MHEILKNCDKRWKKITELHIYKYFVLYFMSKRYKQCSNALFVKALQTLQTLHIFESQARVRI